jgi:glucose-6-phosphate 1-dehydrogenase
VFEKPFGEDLASAVQLNRDIHSLLDEQEIYRVDHYLGKQLVQNILTLRFANEIFAGAWCAQAIDHVQITVAETLGVEKRAGYYDRSGAVRDMLQNHLLQLLSLVAMEPPAEAEADGVRDEAVKVMEQLRPLTEADIVLGQYGAGSNNGENVPAYRREGGVADASTTETYVTSVPTSIPAVGRECPFICGPANDCSIAARISGSYSSMRRTILPAWVVSRT